MTKQQFSLVVAGLCGYELAAIASMGRIPTLTELNRRYKHSVGVPILIGLAVHFYADWPTERVLDDGKPALDWRLRLRGYQQPLWLRDKKVHPV
jgi:hypothetical protein